MNFENTPVLSVENVSKTFAGKPAVKNVSFGVKKGEIVGFLGPNGAGKTTTLRMALGLISPDSGENGGRVRLFGGRPGADAYGRIGFLPEERGLYRKIKAREAIAHIARLNGMKRHDAFKAADTMMDKYGLSDAKHKKIKDLSKGMAQKVQLIAAIAHDPEFLILDEPFSGLDPVNQKLLENMVREIAERGRTIIFSTHVMEHAERLCDRIILMSGGQKIFDGDLPSALAYAPKRLTVEAHNANTKEVLAPFAKEMEKRREHTWRLVLKDEFEPHMVLQACIDKKLKLDRFEPERVSLHDAFVNLVSTETAIHEKTGT
ncbi:MAG: ABC transporter ATP-binding protein [Robiginitomaculum sp.]|nr:MAG: ABC transporter ATP-binding protein [Robiginitomaculum sp.]